MKRDRIIPNFFRMLTVRKYKVLYMFGRIRCGGANFHMESGGGGGGGGGDNVPREEVRHQNTV